MLSHKLHLLSAACQKGTGLRWLPQLLQAATFCCTVALDHHDDGAAAIFKRAQHLPAVSGSSRPPYIPQLPTWLRSLNSCWG